MNRMKKFVLLVCVLSCIFMLAACGNTDKTAEQDLTLEIATMPSIDKVPIIVGIEQGYFEKYGLILTNHNFQSPTDSDAAFQSGQMDGIMSDMVATALYLEAGMDLKMTSVVQTGFGVLASPQSGIKTVSDIKPEHIYGISLNGLIEYLADTAGNAEKVLLPPVSSRVEQLVAGQIDLTVVPEPYVTMAANMGAVKLATDKDLGVEAAVMLFSSKAIQEKPEAIAAFYKGYADALAYIAEADFAEYMDTVIEKGEFSEGIAAALKNTEFEPLHAPSQGQWENIITWMQANPELNGNYDFAFENVCDTQFLQ